MNLFKKYKPYNNTILLFSFFICCLCPKLVGATTLAHKVKSTDQDDVVVQYIKEGKTEEFKKYIEQPNRDFDETYACQYGQYKEINQLQIIHLLAIYDQKGEMTQCFFETAVDNDIKIDMAAMTKRKWTALHFAAQEDNLVFYEIVEQTYAEHRSTMTGLNIHLKTNNGRTPRDFVNRQKTNGKTIEKIIKNNSKNWKQKPNRKNHKPTNTKKETVHQGNITQGTEETEHKEDKKHKKRKKKKSKKHKKRKN
ncbi:MAG: hypothetical protein ACPGC9_00580 [Cytophagales bacterium]